MTSYETKPSLEIPNFSERSLPTDALLEGKESIEHHVGNELQNIKYARAPYGTAVRVERDGPKLRTLKPLQHSEVFAVAHWLGGKVDKLGTSALSNAYGSESFDITMASGVDAGKKKEFTTAEVAQFGHASLIGSEGTNLLVLTTEGAGGLTVKAIQQKDLDSARKYLSDKGLDFDEATLNQRTQGSAIYNTSTAFVVKS